MPRWYAPALDSEGSRASSEQARSSTRPRVVTSHVRFHRRRVLGCQNITNGICELRSFNLQVNPRDKTRSAAHGIFFNICHAP